MRVAIPILRPLAIPSVALLWGGLATSAIGDQLFNVVLSWVAVGLLGPVAGYLASAQAAVVLAVALLAGGWADRREQRHLMIVADLARAFVLLAVVAVWMANGTPSAVTLFACVVVLAAGRALFRPALQSTLPKLVDDHALLPASNALLDTTDRIARLLGPGLVSLAAGVVAIVHFVTIDAATFVISAVAVHTIRRLRPEIADAGSRPRRERTWSAMRRGFVATRRYPLLWFSLLTGGAVNGAWYAAYFLALPLLLSSDLDSRPGEAAASSAALASYGLVISCYGVTNLAATLVIGGRRLPRRPAWLLLGGNVFVGGGIVGLSLAAAFAPAPMLLPVLCLSAGFSAIGGPMHDVTGATLMQRWLGADVAAGVRAALVVDNLGLLIALALAPRLIASIGVAAVLGVCGATIVSIGVVGLLRFREPDGGAEDRPIADGGRAARV